VVLVAVVVEQALQDNLQTQSMLLSNLCCTNRHFLH
jgi:hypothetical protein